MLPRRFGQVVAVAATVYRGIHRSLRRNGYDNFRHRAHTSFAKKLWLGAKGRWRLARLKRRLHKTPRWENDKWQMAKEQISKWQMEA